MATLGDIARVIARERAAVRAVNRFVACQCARLGIDPRRNPWSTVMTYDFAYGCRIAVCRLTVHRYDPDVLMTSHVRGRVGGRVRSDGSLEGTMRTAIVRRLKNLRRCLAFEDKLKAAGLDSNVPPAVAYRTDLMTRRLFEAWSVDLDLFVSLAPKPVRSRRYRVASLGLESCFDDDPSASFPVQSPALADDFPAIACDFKAGLLRSRSIDLERIVQVRPVASGAHAFIAVSQRLPETIVAASIGLPLAALVASEVFDHPAIVILGAEATATGTLFVTSNPIVPLAGPY